MKISHSYGSKERLYEMMEKVNKINLNENKLSRAERINVIKSLIKFVDDKLNLGENMPKIVISYKDGEAKEMRSFGKNTPEANEIVVVDANRNLADTCRTLIHELKHTDQFVKRKLTSASGEDGSDIENEANAFAGSVMREFGRNHPEIFE